MLHPLAAAVPDKKLPAHTTDIHAASGIECRTAGKTSIVSQMPAMQTCGCQELAKSGNPEQASDVRYAI
jgi:hypothetical protein